MNKLDSPLLVNVHHCYSTEPFCLVTVLLKQAFSLHKALNLRSTEFLDTGKTSMNVIEKAIWL